MLKLSGWAIAAKTGDINNNVSRQATIAGKAHLIDLLIKTISSKVVVQQYLSEFMGIFRVVQLFIEVARRICGQNIGETPNFTTFCTPIITLRFAII